MKIKLTQTIEDASDDVIAKELRRRFGEAVRPCLTIAPGSIVRIKGPWERRLGLVTHLIDAHSATVMTIVCGDIPVECKVEMGEVEPIDIDAAAEQPKAPAVAPASAESQPVMGARP